VRVQAPARDEQHGEAGAGLFVVDADVASFVERHGGFSFPICCHAPRSAASAPRGSEPGPADVRTLVDQEFDPVLVSAQPRSSIGLAVTPLANPCPTPSRRSRSPPNLLH